MAASLLKGKVVVITGAASGIGKATSKLLAKNGVLLSLADINEQGLAKFKSELQNERGGAINIDQDILTFVVDVRSAEACNKWITDTVSYFNQPIWGAANIAGVFGPNDGLPGGTIRNLTNEEFDAVFDVNVKGLLNCLRAQLPRIQVGQGGRGGGSIVNTSSLQGTIPMPLSGPYAASKHAINSLTRTAAKEEGERAIRVNAIAPGVISTPMIARYEESTGGREDVMRVDPGALARRGDSEEIAELIAYLLSPASSFVTGALIAIDGGWAC
ncbi:Short-chain dehydrogenase/reductase aba4 [Cladobotryum mycophilum]|uniref:Short-chain dehydrogenase/reductase aba4 n=1 Tax=Cladobotryum mycophilum TaxID=491253 RepID=A0ABR0SVZ7_9HYPO